MKRSNRAWITMGILSAAVVSATSAVHAQSASENTALFGGLGQNLANVTNTNAAFMGVYNSVSVPIGPNACVPTATINGLTYLENYQASVNLPDPFTTSPNSQAQINAIATNMNTYNTTNLAGMPPWQDSGGTLIPSAFNGLQTYLTSNPAPTVKISGQVSPSTPAGFVQTNVANASAGTYNPGTNVASANPSAQFMANALNANDGVEIGLEWGFYNGSNGWVATGGGHFLTLQAINITGGNGTIDFYDPWGTGSGPGNTNGYVAATVSTINNFLYVTYPITWTGGDSDTSLLGPGEALGGDGDTGRIDVVAVEAVPEPASIGLLILTGSALTIRRRRSIA
jgi:hypothetical protein